MTIWYWQTEERTKGDNMDYLLQFNIGSGNGLYPDGTKPLPDPMFIYH